MVAQDFENIHCTKTEFYAKMLKEVKENIKKNFQGEKPAANGAASFGSLIVSSPPPSLGSIDETMFCQLVQK